MRLGSSTDKKDSGRLHVDFAQARDDFYEWECKQRMRAREERHRRKLEEDRLRPPSPPPIMHYSEHEAALLAEKLKGRSCTRLLPPPPRLPWPACHGPPPGKQRDPQAPGPGVSPVPTRAEFMGPGSPVLPPAAWTEPCPCPALSPAFSLNVCVYFNQTQAEGGRRALRTSPIAGHHLTSYPC